MTDIAPISTPRRRNDWLLALLLVAGTVLAYLPAWHAGFIWDDDRYVTRNPLLTAPDGLRRIWFSTDSPSQYFPLVYTTFRLEHALWGLNPVGYHWVNLLLHAANALLVWRLLRNLRIPGAWFAAAIFALHPVNVESVAWITELKNVESLFFVLLALLAWIRFLSDPLDPRSETLDPRTQTLDPKSPAAAAAWYILTLVCYVLALFSKTTACTLPVVLLLVLWLQKVRIDFRRIAQVIPFFVLGLAMGLVSMWWERYQQGTVGKAFALGLAERLLVASHALWFYLGKLLWPAELVFAYPQWKLEPANVLAYGWLAAAVAAAVAIFVLRRRTGRSVEVAACFFFVTLAPTLGFFMLFTFQYKFVADHYQYMACLGPIALAAAAAARLGAGVRVALVLRGLACAVVLLTLGALTWRQCRMYENLETLWRATLARNPTSFLALNNLGELLLDQGRLEEAEQRFRQTLEVKPDSAQAHSNLGVVLLHRGQTDAAVREFQTAIAIAPNLAEAYKNLSDVYIAGGRMEDAMRYAHKAVDLKPDFPGALNNLGNALLNLGRVDDAIVQLEKALSIQPNFPNALNNLGVALIQKGRIADATALFQRTIVVLPEFAQAHHNLGKLELQQGHAREAVVRFETALKIQPDDPDTLTSLAWVLATWPDAAIRDGAKAVTLAHRASELDAQSPAILGTLAAAYAEAGRFSDAVAAAQRAVRLAEAQSNRPLAELLRAQLERHQHNLPMRESVAPQPTAATVTATDHA